MRTVVLSQQERESPGIARGSRRFTLAVVALVVAGGLTAAWVLWMYRFVDIDDGGINYRYVRNLLAGNGWTFNRGEIWNGSTSVLNPVVTALATIVFRNIARASHLVGYTLLTTGSLLLAGYWARRGWWLAAILVPATALTFPPFLNTWGLEIQLFMGLIFLYTFLELRGRNTWPILGLIVLARPDGCILVGIRTLREILRTRRIPWRGIGQVALVLSPWLAYSLIRFHSILPDTLSVKVSQGKSPLWGEDSYVDVLRTLVDALLGTYRNPVLVLAAAGGVYVLATRRFPLADLGFFVIIQQVGYAVLDPASYHWYYSVFLYALVFYAVVAGQAFVVLLGRFRARVPFPATALSVVGALLIAWPLWARWLPRHEQPALLPGYRTVAAYLNTIPLDRETSIALAEVGTVGYHVSLDIRIVDIVALTSPNPPYYLAENVDRFFRNPPTFVLFRTESDRSVPEDVYQKQFPRAVGIMEQPLYNDPRFARHYVVARKWPDPGYGEFTLFERRPGL